MSALACMMKLSLPHLNILTKCDLISGDEVSEEILCIDQVYTLGKMVVNDGDSIRKKKLKTLAINMSDTLNEYGLVR